MARPAVWEQSFNAFVADACFFNRDGVLLAVGDPEANTLVAGRYDPPAGPGEDCIVDQQERPLLSTVTQLLTCDSGSVASTTTGGIVLVPPDGSERSVSGPPCRGAVSGLCLLDGGSARVAACCDQGSVAVADLFAGRTVARVEEGVACTACDAVDASTLAVACASTKGALRLYDFRSESGGPSLATAAWHGDRRQPWARRLLTALAVDPLDASLLAAGTAGGDFLCFDLRSLGHGPVAAARVGSPAEVTGCALSPRDRGVALATNAEGGVWRVTAAGESQQAELACDLVCTLPGPASRPSFRSDGERALAVGDSTVAVLEFGEAAP